MQQISRRRFVAMTATGIAIAPRTLMASDTPGAINAQDVIDRIRKSVGLDWKPETVDTLKAGDPQTPVTGIVTSSLASLEVFEAAVKIGANLIVSCEPTFFSKAETPLASDPVFQGKAEFIRKHKLLAWRFSDHWRRRSPDPFAQGLAQQLGWAKFFDPQNPNLITIPAMTLAALTGHVKTSLKIRGGLRIIGDPKLHVRRLALLPGSTPLQAAIKSLPGADAILAGEVREWETVEYVRDTVALGGKKALLLTGRIVSEDPGMAICAQWLKALVPEVPCRWITAGDPYWRPVA